MGHFYRFSRGDRVVIVSGQRTGALGVVDSAVFQRTVDYPEEYSPGYHVVLADETVVTVRWDQVERV
jgi:ribosomal protein L24